MGAGAWRRWVLQPEDMIVELDRWSATGWGRASVTMGGRMRSRRWRSGAGAVREGAAAGLCRGGGHVVLTGGCGEERRCWWCRVADQLTMVDSGAEGRRRMTVAGPAS